MLVQLAARLLRGLRVVCSEKGEHRGDGGRRSVVYDFLFKVLEINRECGT